MKQVARTYTFYIICICTRFSCIGGFTNTMILFWKSFYNMLFNSETLTLRYFASRIRPQCSMLHVLKTEVFSLAGGGIPPLSCAVVKNGKTILFGQKWSVRRTETCDTYVYAVLMVKSFQVQESRLPSHGNHVSSGSYNHYDRNQPQSVDGNLLAFM